MNRCLDGMYVSMEAEDWSVQAIVHEGGVGVWQGNNEGPIQREPFSTYPIRRQRSGKAGKGWVVYTWKICSTEKVDARPFTRKGEMLDFVYCEVQLSQAQSSRMYMEVEGNR